MPSPSDLFPDRVTANPHSPPDAAEHLVLGIESSCDETGIALYSTARGLLAHALHSQVEMHAASKTLSFAGSWGRNRIDERLNTLALSR